MRCSGLCMFWQMLFVQCCQCSTLPRLIANICFASTYENIPPRSSALISNGSISEQKVSPGDCPLYLQTQALRA